MVNVSGGLTGLIVGVLILALGIGLVFSGWSAQQGAEAAIEDAVETEGTVVATGIEEVEVSSTESGTHTEYAPEITYRYTYQNDTYKSTSICPGELDGCTAANARGRNSTEAFLAQYPDNATIPVYVVPDTPDRSFLVKTDSGSMAHFIMIGIGAIALLGGAIAVLGGIKELIVG